MTRKSLWLVLGIALLPAGAAATPPPPPIVVDPALGCGQTLDDADRTYILGGDLWCPEPGDGVVIAASGITFHLAGHTIASPVCDTSQFVSGIVIDPAAVNVRVEGGTVSGFNDGILLYGTRNRVRGMTFTGACVWGIVVSGQALGVETSVITASGTDGIVLEHATNARIASNFISGNGRAGVSLTSESNGNVVENNLLIGNGQTEGSGVVIFGGGQNRVRKNALRGNVNGIWILTPLNEVSENMVTRSVHTGIFAADGQTALSGNSVYASGVSDMADPTPNCGSNKWTSNAFETDLVDGVSDGGPGVGCI
jgi:parallel beta-helix repeat protein